MYGNVLLHILRYTCVCIFLYLSFLSYNLYILHTYIYKYYDIKIYEYSYNNRYFIKMSTSHEFFSYNMNIKIRGRLLLRIFNYNARRYTFTFIIYNKFTSVPQHINNVYAWQDGIIQKCEHEHLSEEIKYTLWINPGPDLPKLRLWLTKNKRLYFREHRWNKI